MPAIDDLQIDPLNFAVVRLQTFFRETPLGPATGFFYRGTLDNRPNYWLVTNWHVLAGRNADDPNQILHTKCALPNRLHLTLVLRPDQPETGLFPPGHIVLQEQFIDLYDAQNQAVWYQHERKNEIDVAVVNMAGAVERFHILGVNELANQHDMAIQIGNEVFILGYPLGFAHFIQTPIWKRGSIASEPNAETPGLRSRVVIDATTRGGMSGAPVIMRAKTHYVTENREIKSHVNATRFLGVYASRPNIPAVTTEIEEDRRAEIGYFYKGGCVPDTITNGIRGPDFGELP